MTASRRCAVCDRALPRRRSRPCVRGCGAILCRAVHRPPCNDVHGQACPNRPLPEENT